LVAAMFLLKSRHGYRDQGATAAGPTQNNITINLPAPARPEDYLKVINIDPVALPE
jgi:hypothetical protein